MNKPANLVVEDASWKFVFVIPAFVVGQIVFSPVQLVVWARTMQSTSAVHPEATQSRYLWLPLVFAMAGALTVRQPIPHWLAHPATQIFLVIVATIIALWNFGVFFFLSFASSGYC